MIDLSAFDPEVVAEQRLTPRKLERVSRYVRLIQGDEPLTLRDIGVGGHYGTSALLHEIVELDILLRRDPKLLQRYPTEVHRFFVSNQDAHSRALVEEYRYLQRVILRCFGETVQVGALVMANAIPRDFYILAESDEPVELFLPQKDEIVEAERLLNQLKARGKEFSSSHFSHRPLGFSALNKHRGQDNRL